MCQWKFDLAGARASTCGTESPGSFVEQLQQYYHLGTMFTTGFWQEKGMDGLGWVWHWVYHNRGIGFLFAETGMACAGSGNCAVAERNDQVAAEEEVGCWMVLIPKESVKSWENRQPQKSRHKKLM